MQTNFIKGSRVVHMIHCVIRIMCMSPFPVYPKLYGKFIDQFVESYLYSSLI